MGNIAIVVLGLMCSLTLAAQDWDSCASELDDLRSRARDGEDQAREVADAKDEVDSKREELQSCLSFPDIFDWLQDGCQSHRSDLDTALDDLESEISNLHYELGRVSRTINSIESYCGLEIVRRTSITERRQPKTVNPLCPTLRRLGARLTRQQLRELCFRYMTKSDCRACLGEEAPSK